jgi:DNA-binding response OmpR family regulator
VLLADGDVARRTATRLFLERSGYTVGEASDGPAALHHANNGSHDLVVLSQGLVGMDAAEVLAHLRSYSSLPAIVVGDVSAEAEQVRFLDLGADDYLVRPSSVAELPARIKVVLRRGAMAAPSSRIEAGDLVIDRSAHRVELRGAPVDLTIREFELLWFLMQSPDQTFSRQALLQQVWGYTGAGQALATVTEHVRRLRLKLERDPANPTLILTEHGYGYRFATRTPNHRYPRT